MFIGNWNSNTLATWREELTHWIRPWCWERLKAGGEGDDRGWYGWMASPTRWTWVWAGSGSWWWTEKPGVVQSVGLQRVGHNWATELNWTVWTCKPVMLTQASLHPPCRPFFTLQLLQSLYYADGSASPSCLESFACSPCSEDQVLMWLVRICRMVLPSLTVSSTVYPLPCFILWCPYSSILLTYKLRSTAFICSQRLFLSKSWLQYWVESLLAQRVILLRNNKCGYWFSAISC